MGTADILQEHVIMYLCQKFFVCLFATQPVADEDLGLSF